MDAYSRIRVWSGHRPELDAEGISEVKISCGLILAVLVAGLFGIRSGEAQSWPIFTDVTAESGLHFRHRFGDDKLSNIVEGTGGGSAMFDYDGDGWLDIYLVSGSWLKEVNDNRGRIYSGKLTNHLFKNNGDGTFRDVTEQAGVGDMSFSSGCSAADYDNDGDVDLYVLNYGKNVLYRNNGDGTFTDVSRQSGLDNPHWSLSAPWFDYDNDGDLDVYVVNYLKYDSGAFRAYYAATGYPGPLSYRGQPDALYRNNGDGTFTEVTREAGLYNEDGRGMSGTVADLDNDGHLDIYISNDAMGNYFYRNLGNGKFEDAGLEYGVAYGESGQGVSSMGPTIGDIDRNGLLDIYVPDMNYGCLMINRKGFFEDRTASAKMAVICGQYTGWGGVLCDFDNDGFLDLFIANGKAHFEFGEEDVIVRNDGSGHFVDVAGESGPYFHDKYVGRGATWGDFDNDGDQDLLVMNLNDSPRLLRNDGGNRNHWLKLALKVGNPSRDAIGARVTVTNGKTRQIQELVPVRGYLSQGDPRLSFGLGRHTKVDRIDILWPDGSRSQRQNVPADQFLSISQPAK